MNPTHSAFTEGLKTRIRQLGNNPNLPLRLLIGAVLVGAAAGYVGVGYHSVVDEMQHMFLAHGTSLMDALAATPWWWKLLLPAFGGLLVAPIVFSWVPQAHGTGTPEVMKAVAVERGYIPGRVVIAKFVASSLTISTGGSAGREGPIIQIGASLGSKIGQLLKFNTTDMTHLVACGAAAGIAAVFNAPIGGAFFALEVILQNFAAKSFAPIVLASVTATAVSRAHLGNFPAFEVPAYTLVSAWEIPLYVVLGLIAGGVGVSLTTTVKRLITFFTDLEIHNYAKPALGGFAVGLFLLVIPEVYGTGFETVSTILRDGLPWLTLLLLLPAKVVATSVTVASGGSGGIFSPSLFLGAVTGSLFGALVHALWPETTGPAGAYALVGMGAVLSGVTHIPITAILMLFEVSGDYHIILPLMVACTTATSFARVLFPDSLYGMKLKKHGVQPDQAREEALMKGFRVRDVMRRDGRTISPDTKLGALVTEFLASRVTERYVIDEQGGYVGFISLHDVKELFNEPELGELVVAADVAHRDTPEVRPDTPLSVCMTEFDKTGVERLPVVSRDGKFLGTISEHEVVGLYNREILKQEFLGTVQFTDAQSEARDNLIQLPHGYAVKHFTVPEGMVGHTLKDLNLRHAHDVTVVSVQDPDTPGRDQVPHAERVLKAGTHLVVVGKSDDLLQMFEAFAIQA